MTGKRYILKSKEAGEIRPMNPTFMKKKGDNAMARITMTPEEERELLLVLERYLPDLEIEMSDTDSREFLHALKEREKFMMELIRRLKEVVS
jgi:hypothetical protein